MTAKGSFQLSVLRRQHEEDEHHRQEKEVHRRVAGRELQECQVGPLGRHRLRQLLIGDLLHQGDRLSRTRVRPRRPVDAGGRVQVVAHDHHRSACIADVQDRAQANHLPQTVADLELADRSDVVAESRVGLDVYLPGAAVLVEVVHVVRAQVDLERVEDVADLHSVDHALGAVDIQVEPGRTRPGAVEEVRQALGPRGPVDDLLAEPLELVQAQVGAVLDDQLEAAGGAQAVDGRCAERRDDGPADLLAAPVPNRLGDRVGVQLRRMAFFKRLEQDVHRTQIGRVGVQDQRLPGDTNRVRDSRGLAPGTQCAPSRAPCAPPRRNPAIAR